MNTETVVGAAFIGALVLLVTGVINGPGSSFYVVRIVMQVTGSGFITALCTIVVCCMVCAFIGIYSLIDGVTRFKQRRRI